MEKLKREKISFTQAKNLLSKADQWSGVVNRKTGKIEPFPSRLSKNSQLQVFWLLGSTKIAEGFYMAGDKSIKFFASKEYSETIFRSKQALKLREFAASFSKLVPR